LSTEEPGKTGGAAAAPPRQRDLTAEILRHFWEKRLFIAKVMAVAVVVFAVALLLVPRKYRAEATIILLPPRFTSDVRTEPLSVATAKSLLVSGELVQEIIDTIRAGRNALDAKGADGAAALAGADPGQVARALGVPDGGTPEYISRLTQSEIATLATLRKADVEGWTAEELARSLETEDIIEKKTAADIKVSPLIRLRVIADSGRTAQLVANTWAILFERKYDEITNLKTRKQVESIEKQQKASQKELEDAYREIVAFKAANNLELFQRKIDEYSQSLQGFLNQRILKENSLRTEERRLSELQRVYAAVTENGQWLGLVDFSAALTTAPSAGRPLKNPDAPATTDVYAAIRDKVIQSREGFLSAVGDSTKFNREYPVETMTKSRDQMQADLLTAQSRMRQQRTQMEALEGTLRSVDAQLSATQRVIVLGKQVPDETIGSAVAGGRGQALRELSQVRFQEEMVNPAWEKLEEQRVEVSRELASARFEMESLEAKMPAMERELEALQRRTHAAQMLEKTVTDSVKRWQEVQQELSDSFVDMNSTIYNTGRQIALLKQELEQLDDDCSRTEVLVQEYQGKYDSAAARLQVLEARQRAVQRNADLMLQKLQDAQVARDQGLSDVSVAASAVAPMRHFFPKRTLSMAILAAITLAALLAALGRAKYLETRHP
jgi:uncharacterized protein involved in exopolysaccharide biosynthesis